MTHEILIYCNGKPVMARWLGDHEAECPCGAKLNVVCSGDPRHSLEPMAEVIPFPKDAA